MRIKSRFDSYNVIVPPEAHSEPSQTSKKEHLVKIVYCSVIVVWILNELSSIFFSFPRILRKDLLS